MRLIRFVAPPGEWRHAMQKKELDAAAPLVPTLLYSFLPSLAERDRISLFRLDDGISELRAAAAWFLAQKNDFGLLTVDEKLVADAGFVLEPTVGKTHYADVNERHVDALLPTADDALRMANLFYGNGWLTLFAPQDVRLQVANDNHSGVVDLAAIAKIAQGPIPNRMCEIVGHKAALLIPASSPADA